MKTKTIALTEDEQKQLEALLDIAVKAAGLGAAAAALNIMSKLAEPDTGDGT